MSNPKKPAEPGGVESGGVEKSGESTENVRPAEQKTGKTLQELERIQFDALDRAGFDR